MIWPLDDIAARRHSGMFRTITLSSTRYGIVSAAFVVFTIVITDFGNPMVIGGDYNVLATEIYNQVSGQGNFQMGAVIGVMLLVPAALAVIAEKWIMRRHHATISERSQPLLIVRQRWRDRIGLAFASSICAMIAAIVLVVVVASFVTLWPYNMPRCAVRQLQPFEQHDIADAALGEVVGDAAADDAAADDDDPRRRGHGHAHRRAPEVQRGVNAARSRSST